MLLCFASGATDALSYLTLGQIFTSAMTGCAALFFVMVLGGHLHAATRAAAALVSYMLGCALGAALQPSKPGDAKSPFTLRRMLMAESLLLGAYCIVSTLGAHPAAGGLRYGLIVISATAMGVQSIIARDLQAPGITTVVLNVTMTSVAVAIIRLLLGRDSHFRWANWLQIFALLGYAVGALLTVLGVYHHLNAIGLLPFGAALAVLSLHYFFCNVGGSSPSISRT